MSNLQFPVVMNSIIINKYMRHLKKMIQAADLIFKELSGMQGVKTFTTCYFLSFTHEKLHHLNKR